MKKLLFLLILLLPVHAWGACYYYDATYSGQKPSDIPSSATKLSNPFSQGTYGDGCSGSLIERYYYDSTLDVYMIIHVCSSCPSGYEAIRNYISVGTCSWPQAAAISYSCWNSTNKHVTQSLPSGATVSGTYGGNNCATSDASPVYVRHASSSTTYYKVIPCVSAASNSASLAHGFPISDNAYTYQTYPVINMTSCSSGTGLKGSSGSTSCSSCVAGTYNNGNYTYCVSASAGYYVSGTGASSQTACVAGSYASGTGNTKCTACAGGKTNTGSGNSSCTTTCSNATGVNTWTTPTWSTSNTVSNLCKISKCNAGYEYNSSSATCAACPVGKYNSTAGGKCTACPAASGVYTDSALTNSPGTTTTTTGATSVNQCVIDTFLGVYYDASGSYSYSVDTCSYNGTGSNSSTVGTTCSDVQPYCLNHNGVSVNEYTAYTTVPAGITKNLDASGTTACWCKQNNKYMWVNSYSQDPEGCMNLNTGCAVDCANKFMLGNYGASMGCTGGTTCDTYKSMCLTVAGTGVVSSLPSGASAGGQYCWCKRNNKYVNLFNMGSAETCSSACDFQCSEYMLEAGTYDSDMGCSTGVACSTVGGACKTTDAAWPYRTYVYNGSSPYYSDTVPSGKFCWCGINGYSFVAANMNFEATCTESCAAYCKSLLTDSDYISQYGLPAKVGCTN